MNYDTYYKYSKRRVKNTKSRLLKLQEKILKETIKIDEELLKRFEDEYDLSSGNYSEILKLLRSKTDEILSKGNFVIEKLQIKRVYIKMDSTEKLQKIVIDEEENIEE